MYKGSYGIVIIVTRVRIVRWGMESMAAVLFYKKVDHDALHFHTGSLKIKFFKVLFWDGGRGLQKRVLCTLLIMLAIVDDP